MRGALISIGLVCLLAAAGATAGEREAPVVPKEKILLFNNKDLAGWVQKVGRRDDDQKVWTVRDGIIHCLGKPHGILVTGKVYANYRLHVEWRWVEKPTNSGVMLHMAGGKSIEAQLMHRHAGDIWLLNRSTLKVDGKTVGPGKPHAHVKMKHPSNEKPPGEWNTCDITCDGGAIRIVVNGLLQNAGTGAVPSSGFIALQSEGSPIQFRNVHLEPLATE